MILIYTLVDLIRWKLFLHSYPSTDCSKLCQTNFGLLWWTKFKWGRTWWADLELKTNQRRVSAKRVAGRVWGWRSLWSIWVEDSEREAVLHVTLHIESSFCLDWSLVIVSSKKNCNMNKRKTVEGPIQRRMFRLLRAVGVRWSDCWSVGAFWLDQQSGIVKM